MHMTQLQQMRTCTGQAPAADPCCDRRHLGPPLSPQTPDRVDEEDALSVLRGAVWCCTAERRRGIGPRGTDGVRQRVEGARGIAGSHGAGCHRGRVLDIRDELLGQGGASGADRGGCGCWDFRP